jgi:hypothetical protein
VSGHAFEDQGCGAAQAVGTGGNGKLNPGRQSRRDVKMRMWNF